MMIVWFKPWFVMLYVFIVLVIIVHHVVVDCEIEFKTNDKLSTKIMLVIAQGLLNFITVGGVSSIVFLMLLLLGNSLKTSNYSINTSTYTNQNVIELTPVKNVNGTDYYLTKDLKTCTYTFATTDPGTGSVTNMEADFDHTIVIPLEDCETPYVIYTHNDHEYYEHYDGDFFLKENEGAFTRTNSDNYNDLYVFLVPINSITELGLESRWV